VGGTLPALRLRFLRWSGQGLLHMLDIGRGLFCQPLPLAQMRAALQSRHQVGTATRCVLGLASGYVLGVPRIDRNDVNPRCSRIS
jgi:hypothetical protein